MARIIVSGELVRYPLGGMNHAFLPWLVGLQQVGHDVYFVERAYWPQSCYDVEKGVKTDDCSYGLEIASKILDRYDFRDRWCFVNNDGQYYGLSRERILEVFRTADVFLELDWNTWLEESATIPVRVFVDSEPGWSHMNQEKMVRSGTALPTYDYYFTDGHNIGTTRCTAPTLGRTWLKYFWPVLVDAIPFEPHTRSGRFSTVMQWKSNRHVTFDGVKYGQKDLEFPKFITLPRLTSAPLEVAVSGKVPDEAMKLLLDSGWHVRNADDVARTLDSYRDYIRSSRGEFGVCKNVFVATNCGVFVERPGCYMASGRPAVVQDTGFSAHLPCGRGLFAVRTVEEAAAALDEIESDYLAHARAAREIAVEFFSPENVLRKMLREIGIC